MDNLKELGGSGGKSQECPGAEIHGPRLGELYRGPGTVLRVSFFVSPDLVLLLGGAGTLRPHTLIAVQQLFELRRICGASAAHLRGTCGAYATMRL